MQKGTFTQPWVFFTLFLVNLNLFLDILLDGACVDILWDPGENMSPGTRSENLKGFHDDLLL